MCGTNAPDDRRHDESPRTPECRPNGDRLRKFRRTIIDESHSKDPRMVYQFAVKSYTCGKTMENSRDHFNNRLLTLRIQ